MKRTLMGDYPRTQVLNLANKKGTYLGSVSYASKNEQNALLRRSMGKILACYHPGTKL